MIPELLIPSEFRKDFPTMTTLQSPGVKTRPGVVAVGKIQYVESPYLEDWEYLRGCSCRRNGANAS